MLDVTLTFESPTLDAWDGIYRGTTVIVTVIYEKDRV